MIGLSEVMKRTSVSLRSNLILRSYMTGTARAATRGITETKLILVGLFVLIPVKYVEHLVGSLRLGFGFVSGSRCLKHHEMCKNEMFSGERSRSASVVKNHPADEDCRRVLDTAQRLFNDV